MELYKTESFNDPPQQGVFTVSDQMEVFVQVMLCIQIPLFIFFS